MQDALTKNIEHVKMKKTSRQISGRGGAGMKTAEILEKTKTFQAAEADILTRISKNSPTSIGGEMNCHLLHSAIVGM